MKIKASLSIFFGLLCLSLFAVLFVNQDLLFPFVTSKALFLRIILDLAFPFYVYLLLVRKDCRPSLKNPLTVSVLAFFAINVLASFTGVNVTNSIWGSIERMGGTWGLLHFVLVYFYVLLLAQISPAKTQKFLKVFLAVAVISMLYGLWVYLKLPGFFADPSLPDRVSSTFGNPIFFASFLILPLSLTLFFAAQEESSGWKVFYYLAAALQLFGILQSATRGAFVGLLAGILIAGSLYLLNAKSKQIRNRGLVVAGGFVAIIALLFIFSSKLPTNSFLHRLTHLQDSNSSSRLILWKMTLRGFKDKPILGVGPENYFVIANKYYNPVLAQYDPSWFDKPHNYLLEILATTGLLGFAAYAAIVASMLWVFWKAQRANLISLLEFTVLCGGLVAYQVQNLFVFDTIAASLSFFVFLGFAGFLWHELSFSGEPLKKEKAPANNALLAGILAVVAAVGAGYSIYLTDAVSWSVFKNINYGIIYSQADPQKAQAYFETAKSQPFIFDRGQLGLRYADFALNTVNDQTDNSKAVLVNSVLDGAIATLVSANRVSGTNPISWYRISELYLAKATFNNSKLDSAAETDAEKALALAPLRAETLSVLAEVKKFEGQNSQAVEIQQRLITLYPKDPSYIWQLAKIYHSAGNDAQAAQTANEALQKGYASPHVDDIVWLVQYYTAKADYNWLIAFYNQEINQDPGNVQWYANLAAVYAKAGDKQQAIATAQKIEALNPAAKDSVEKFIQNLK